MNIDLAANPTYQDAVMRIVKEHSDIKFFLALPLHFYVRDRIIC